jgi:hypothetical protein
MRCGYGGAGMRDTSQVGLISHTAVLNRLVQLGFEVLLPWANHLGYDLAYFITEEHRNFGFFAHQESRLVRIQVKTARLSQDGTYLEFNTASTVSARKGNRKNGYDGRAEYFAVYNLDLNKVYMFPVVGAPRNTCNLRFKEAGMLRGNRHKTWHEPYSEEIAHSAYWAEDYEL